MTHGRKKVTRIVEELTLYFFSMGAQNVESAIELDGQWAKIRFHADYDNAQKVHVDKAGSQFRPSHCHDLGSLVIWLKEVAMPASDS